MRFRNIILIWIFIMPFITYAEPIKGNCSRVLDENKLMAFLFPGQSARNHEIHDSLVGLINDHTTPVKTQLLLKYYFDEVYSGIKAGFFELEQLTVSNGSRIHLARRLDNGDVAFWLSQNDDSNSDTTPIYFFYTSMEKIGFTTKNRRSGSPTRYLYGESNPFVLEGENNLYFIETGIIKAIGPGNRGITIQKYNNSGEIDFNYLNSNVISIPFTVWRDAHYSLVNDVDSN